MTDYPGNPLEALGADGAFQIGGGAFQFGQQYTESIIKQITQMPIPNPANAVQILQEQLSRLPLEALQMFKQLIPGTIDDDFIDIATSVGTIIANLANLPRALLTGHFDEWVATTFDVVSTEVRQILEILSGLIVTPINSAVQGVKDWFTGITAFQSTTAADLGNVQTVLNQIGDIFAGLTVTPVSNVVQAVKDNWTLAQENMQNTWNGFVGAVQGIPNAIGQGVNDFVGATQSWFDSLRQQILGISSTGASAADAAAAAGSLRSTVQDLQNTIRLIQDGMTPVSSALKLQDVPNDSSGTTSDWGPNWTMRGNGTVKRSTTAFEWIDSGNVSRSRYGTFNTPTAGDRQRAGYIFDSLMESPANGSSPNCGNGLMVRSDAAGNNGVYMRNYFNKVELGRVASGVLQAPWATSATAPQAASFWEVLAGSEDSDYDYTVLQNGKVVLTYRDNAHASTKGASNRYGGQFMISDARGTGESTPGRIKSFRLEDAVTLGIPDMGISVRSTTGPTAGAPPLGSVAIVQGWYDTVDQKSPGINWDYATSKITFTKPGMYQVRISFGLDIATSAACVLVVNGSTQLYGTFHKVDVSNGIITESYTEWFNAGDYIQPAIYEVAGNPKLVGASYRSTFKAVGIPSVLSGIAA